MLRGNFNWPFNIKDPLLSNPTGEDLMPFIGKKRCG
jgi:hypothetical protein